MRPTHDVCCSLVRADIFQVFFAQFFGICVFGMAHGLLFLPVLLSLVGPAEINVEDSPKANAPELPTDVPPKDDSLA